MGKKHTNIVAQNLGGWGYAPVALPWIRPTASPFPEGALVRLWVWSTSALSIHSELLPKHSYLYHLVPNASRLPIIVAPRTKLSNMKYLQFIRVRP